MIPVGYLAKKVAARPEWLKAESVTDIYSVSGCISADFRDILEPWRHNGYWFFDSPKIVRELAEKAGVDLQAARMFFYECFDQQFDETTNAWSDVAACASFVTAIETPDHKVLEGFDVVTFSGGTSPECSPLSCNGLAEQMPVNEHCLLASLDEARGLLARRAFDNSEPGPFRVFAVYSVR